MTDTEKLLKRLPEKYHERVYKLDADDGLTEDEIEGQDITYKYMLYFAKDWAWNCISCIPVVDMSEAAAFVRESSQKRILKEAI